MSGCTSGVGLQVLPFVDNNFWGTLDFLVCVFLYVERKSTLRAHAHLS